MQHEPQWQVLGRQLSRRQVMRGAALISAGLIAGRAPTTVEAAAKASPVVVRLSRFPVTNPPAGAYSVFQVINDLLPGGRFREHMHNGLGCFSATIDGYMAIATGGKEHDLAEGQSFRVPDGQYHYQINRSSSAGARQLATFLVPAGMPATVANPDAPAPSVSGRTAFSTNSPVTGPGPAFELVQLVVDFPGAETWPLKSLGGPAVLTVLQGEMRVRAGSAETTLAAGQTYADPEGKGHEVRGTATGETRVAATYLVGPGVALPSVGAPSLRATVQQDDTRAVVRLWLYNLSDDAISLAHVRAPVPPGMRLVSSSPAAKLAGSELQWIHLEGIGSGQRRVFTYELDTAGQSGTIMAWAALIGERSNTSSLSNAAPIGAS